MVTVALSGFPSDWGVGLWSEAPAPGPIREETSRRRAVRRVLWGIGLVVLGAVLVGTVLYYRQIASYLTHTVASPRDTYELVPFAPDEQPDLRIAVAGDVGDGGNLSWRTAASMYVVSKDDPYDVLFLLGDNLYPKGDVRMLDELILNPFAPLLDSGTDLRAVLGNHDGMAADGGERQMELLGMPGRWWSTVVGDMLLVGLDGNQLGDPGQLIWLEQTLADSDAHWKIVATHQSPFSAGYQGSSEVARGDYVPIFEAYGVDLVLSGHDHDYQRSVPLNGVTYVVSGGGAGTRRTGTERYTAYSASAPHFVDLHVFPDRLVLRAVNHDLRMFDEVVIAP
jgi:hypothetical protein